MTELIRIWTPYFRVFVGMSREDMLDLSIPDLVDIMDYEQEMRRG